MPLCCDYKGGKDNIEWKNTFFNRSLAGIAVPLIQ